MRKYWIFIVPVALAGLVLSRLHREQVPTSIFQTTSLRDYVHLPNIAPLFRQADSLKYALDYDDAVAAFEQLLQIELSPEQRGYALNQLAYLNLKIQRDSAATRWLDMLQRTWPHPETMPQGIRADWAWNRGMLAFHQDRPQEALDWLREAQTRYIRLYGPDHWQVAQCLNQLAMVHYEYTPAFDSFCLYAPKGYELLLAHPEWKPCSQEIELSMGYLSLWHRDYQVGETYCDNALNLAQSAPYFDTLFVARCLSMKGNMLKKLGQQDEADQMFEQAIAWGKQTSSLRLQEFYKDRIINCMYRKAEGWPCFSEHLAELELLLKKQPDRYAYPERLRAYYQFMLGDYAACITNYETFLQRHLMDSLCQPLIIEEAHYCLVYSYLALGDYDAALKNARLLLTDNNPGYSGRLLPLRTARDTAVLRHLQNPFVGLGIIANVLLEKYRSGRTVHDLQEAFAFYALTDSLLFPSIVPTDEDAILAHQSEFGSSIYPNAVEATYALYARTKDPRYLDYAFRFSERMKSFLLYRDMNLPPAVDQPNRPPENLLDTLRRLDAQVKKLKMRRLRKEFVTNRPLYDQLALAQSRIIRLYQQLKTDYPAFYKERTEQPVATVAQVKKQLRSGQAVVQYSIGEGAIHILFIATHKVEFYQTVLPDSVLQAYCRDYYSALSTQSPHQDADGKVCYEQSATELYRCLIGPFAHLLREDSALILIPDQVLHSIPFEALIQPGHHWDDYRMAPYLLRQAEITYAPSWKVYQSGLDKGRELPLQPRVLAFTYGSKGNLAYAGVELNSIGRQFEFSQAVRIAQDDACSSQHFKEQLQSGYDILHLSLHASSSLREKLDNKIIFSQLKPDTLYGFDLLPYRTTAKLIVLSACETASGATKPGEGTYSLSRAFLQAGAVQVVASLWPVSDYTTSQLLAEFYAGLARRHLSPPAALRQAKQNYLLRMDAFKSHPAYWAGLLCQG